FIHGALLLPIVRYTEYPGHAVGTSEEALREGTSLSAVQNVAYALRCLMMAQRHLPLEIPQPTHVSVRRAVDLARRHCGKEQHTRFLPSVSGLTYLNEAIRWVHCYGSALIEFYLDTVGRIDLSRYREVTGPTRTGLIRSALAGAAGSAPLVEHRGSRVSIKS